MASNTLTAPVLKHFVIPDDLDDITDDKGNFKLLCKYCSVTISASRRAFSNLNLHLKRRHKPIHDELTTPQEESLSPLKQRKLTPVVLTPKKYANSDTRQNEITDSLVSLVAGDLLPLSLVESDRFKHFVNTIDPRYQVPGRKHLSTTLLPKKSDNVLRDVMRRLELTEKVSVTIDLWSSRQMRSYYGITCHFISDWTLHSVMLACTRFRGSHTADAISEQFEKTAATFNISNKVSHIITDNASNMVKAFTLPGFEDSSADNDSDDENDDDDLSHETDDDLYDQLNLHEPCFAHTLQLVIKDGFKNANSSINKVLAKTAVVVNHVRRSIHASELLEDERRVQTANVTRWNSQLISVKSVLKIDEEKLNQLDLDNNLNAYDRNILKDMVEILTPFETVTHEIQGNCVVTGSLVIPYILILQTKMDELSEKFSSKFVKTLKDSVHKRLGHYEKNESFRLASALDPRFRLRWCTDSDELSTVKKDLRTKAMVYAKSTTTTDTVREPPTKKRRGFFSSLIDQPTVCPSTDKSIDTEIEEYANEPCIEETECPLMCWKTKENKFPRLSKMAPNFLCIPASSAPVERLFSIAGKIFRPERCRLSDARSEQLMFVRCNEAKPK